MKKFKAQKRLFMMIVMFGFLLMGFATQQGSAATTYNVSLRVSSIDFDNDGDGIGGKGELYIKYTTGGHKEDISDDKSQSMTTSESPYYYYTGLSSGDKIYFEVRDSDWGATSESFYDLLWEGYIEVKGATSTVTVQDGGPGDWILDDPGRWTETSFGTNKLVRTWTTQSSHTYYPSCGGGGTSYPCDPWSWNSYNSLKIDVSITAVYDEPYCDYLCRHFM